MEFTKVLVVISAMLKVSSGIFTVQQTSDINKFVQAVMTCRQIPGLSLTVVKGNKTWTRGFGDEDTAKGIRVSSDTLFGIGSVTKAFTATLLAMLIEDTNGSITWNSKVKDVLGSEFAFVDDERTRDTTIRDLLTHRTGLATVINFPMLAGLGRNFTRKELSRRFRFLPEVNALRDVYDYNNWGYALAGHVVEMLSGESWEDTLEKRIFRSLGMTNSRVLGKTVQTNDDGVAKPYFRVDNEMMLTDPAIYDIHPFEAAGAIASTANDMAKWLHFLLREGKTGDGRELINSELLKETLQTQQSLPEPLIRVTSLFRPQYPVCDVNYGYGYGWESAAYRGFQKVRHSGALHSYVSYIQVFPEQDFGIFSVANGAGTNDMFVSERMIHFLISDFLLREEPWVDSSIACTFPSPFSNSTIQVEDNSDLTNTRVGCADCYLGKYGHHLFGDVEIKVNERSGILEMVYGKIRGTLNSTDDAATFKLDIVGLYRLLSHPLHYTALTTVYFDKMQEGRYQLFVMPLDADMNFTRGVSFFDPGVLTTKSSGEAKTDADNFHMVLVLVFTIIML